MKLLKKIILLTIFSLFLTFGIKTLKTNNVKGDFFVGVSYYMSTHGYDAEQQAIVGVIGVAEGSLYSYLAGAALGGPAGIAVGVAAGL